ncbi:cytochrome c oxidase subunit 4 isoform 1, mitochondrial-like [Onthophagus taurus]|uniref:cytochrome c oxidase subunit 4 isoform 1, mitochondrial-like n=1 Tax=Onthophagus taurus TaxID=166361 RepID=UPI000C200C60|nr:cytochrome c oxidase subunit 4 isoform 1, mitochondrial-like [Onthophagus taurus]
MASRILTLGLRSLKKPIPLGYCAASDHSAASEIRALIGNREVVGFGHNGQPNYVDSPSFPLPAIRWKEPTKDILALKEKEKGDWHKLSIEEKKALYRASFRQTFSEFKAPSGEWKSIFGFALFFASLGLWMFIALKVFVYNPLPISFDEEHKRAQLKRMLDLKMNPVTGIASEWDYEKNKWK